MRRVGVILLFCVGVVVATAAPAASASTTLDDIEVGGAFGEAPTLDYPKPFASKTNAHRDVIEGDGERVKKNERISVNFAVFDGRTAEELDSSFGDKAQSLVLDSQQTVPALVKGLIGSTVGSRVLVAIPPKAGIAEQLGNPAVKKKDTLLFVLDVIEVRKPLARAEGETVAPVDGLPKVKLGGKGKPTITPPESDAPTQLVVQPLIKGAGPVVQAGQTITVHYTGAIWATGKTFDSSWDSGTPAEFSIGTGEVISGWDEGLVGQTVGSQVLLVVPPDKGYGATGSSDGTISGTDTLVFVVDILDAY